MAALAAVLVLGAALRFYRLDRESLWTDEVLSVELARRPWPALLSATQEDGHPPLYLTALRLWVGAFGDGETGVRSLSAVIGVATLAAFFVLAARLLPMRGALLATLLLACSPYHVYYSQEARNYALLLLLTVLSYLALLAWDERPRPGRAIAYVAATALLLYTHVFGFFVWGAQILWTFARARQRGDGLARLLPSMAIAVLVLPWLFAPWTAMLLRQTSARTTGLHLTRPSLWSLFTSAYQFTGAPPTAVVLLPAAALELYHALVRDEGQITAEGGRELSRRQRAVLLLLWAALPQLVPFVISQFAVPIYITRATIVTLPVLYLLAAAFLDRLGGRWCFALVSIAVLSSLGAQALYFKGRTKEQWREAAGTVDARAQAGDVVVFDAGYGRRGFDHYSHAPALRKIAIANDLTSPAGARELAVLPADTRRLWVVRFQRTAGRERVVEALAARYQLAGFAAYQGIELFLFEKAGD
jgi:4-amino-4-deoxy-L-arabinose transferase-like glycosyltransferase